MGNRYNVVRWLGGALLVACLAGGMAGCGTQKNTASRRAYHRVTSYFNYYFNARQSYQAGERLALQNVRYDYTRPLPLCLAGLPDASLETGGEMDRVIEKCASLIRLHSLTVKPERGTKPLTAKEKKFYSQNEFNKYARKAWLLIGKARLWTLEYDQAREALEFSMRQFSSQVEGWESQLWMARLEMLTGDTLRAQERLASLAVSPLHPKDKAATHLLESMWADVLVMQGAWAEALPHALAATNTARRGHERARCRLALAQLYELCERPAEALALYKKVARSAPSYEMSFNATLRGAALAARNQGSGMQKSLRKLAKDSKNKEYLDQIYYALGQIAMAQGDTARAIELYCESAAKSTSNEKQKGISFKTVADYHYARKAYLQADAFYDSTLSVLPESSPAYPDAWRKSRALGKLANAARTIAREDSLRRVAAMPEKERDAFIRKLIEEVVERERQERLVREQEARDRNFAMQNQYRAQPMMQSQQGSSFYFYNTATLSYGRTDFRMRWGDRKLEDNWRRRNKSLVAETDDESENPENPQEKKPKLTNRQPEYYLQDLPLTDSARQASDVRIAKALLEQGDALRNDVENYPEAIKAYTSLADRYPKSAEAEEACYLAYMAARTAHLRDQEIALRQRILRDYPQSSYAQMLGDPDYMLKQQQAKARLEDLYAKSWEALKRGERSTAQGLAAQGATAAGSGEYAPRFALMGALSAGAQAGGPAQVQALQGILASYPNTPESLYATEVLHAIERRTLTGAAQKEALELAETPTEPDPLPKGYRPMTGEHYLALLFTKESNLQDITFKTLTFCVDYNVNLNLHVTQEPLNETTSIVLVKTFESRSATIAFLEALLTANVYEDLRPTPLIIAPANYQLLREQGTFLPYQEFYQKQYSQKTEQ